jgi:hypothetical protein
MKENLNLRRNSENGVGVSWGNSNGLGGISQKRPFLIDANCANAGSDRSGLVGLEEMLSKYPIVFVTTLPSTRWEEQRWQYHFHPLFADELFPVGIHLVRYKGQQLRNASLTQDSQL